MNTKTPFVKSILLACIGILFLSSCEDSAGISSKGFAPKSIEGKTFKGKVHFENSSTFSFVKDVEDENTRIIGTLDYSYRKTGDDTADLTYGYTLEHYGNFSSIMNYTETYSVTYHLHFTSAEAGWATGSQSYIGLPSYLSYDPSIEYTDFTLY